MTRAELGLVTFVARAGLTARSAVFALLGFFLLRVASSADEGRARDLGDLGVDTVVRTLMAWPAGVLPAGLLAGGLVCFGVYSLCCAYWVRLPSRDTATASGGRGLRRGRGRGGAARPGPEAGAA
jgi:hypothetical protein